MITTSTIRDNRFRKEIDLIRLHHDFELQEYPDGAKDIVFLLSYKFLEKLPFVIHLSKDYPFVEPEYSFNPPEVQFSASKGIHFQGEQRSEEVHIGVDGSMESRNASFRDRQSSTTEN